MKISKTRSATDIKRLTVTAMLAALAFLVVMISTQLPPVVLFLKYDPKDIIIAIGGFIYGPITSVIISIIVSVLEMATVSTTGIIGCVMNIISSVAFCVPAAMIYRKRHDLTGAVIGLVTGAVSVCAAMMLWNYLITPLYMTSVTRAQIAAMLPTVFLPFNLLKATLNASLAMIIYKPTVRVLRAARLLPASDSSKKGGNTAIIAIISAVLVAALCIFLIIYWQNV